MYLKTLFSVLILTFIMASCTNKTTSVDPSDDSTDPDPDDVTTIRIDNMGATAYVFIGIDGDGATTDLDTQNADIELKIGERFVFRNEAGASNHPLDFRNSDREKLLGQSNSSGLFDDNEQVGLEKDGNTISFTLTPDLASLLDDYICSFHPGMNGSVQIIE